MRDAFGLNDPHSDSFSVSDVASASSTMDKVRREKGGTKVGGWGRELGRE